MIKKFSFILSLLLVFNTVHSVGPLERQRDEDCRMYTCAGVVLGLVIIGMAVGFTCMEDSECFSRKPRSNDTDINETFTNHGTPASLNYPPAPTRIKPRRSGRDKN